MCYRLTEEEMEAVRAGRLKDREKRWGELFSVGFTMKFIFYIAKMLNCTRFDKIVFNFYFLQRYAKEEDIDDVVIWEDDEGYADKMPENNEVMAMDVAGSDAEPCIEVSDEDEDQNDDNDIDEEEKVFLNAFQKVRQTHATHPCYIY